MAFFFWIQISYWNAGLATDDDEGKNLMFNKQATALGIFI